MKAPSILLVAASLGSIFVSIALGILGASRPFLTEREQLETSERLYRYGHRSA